MSERFEGLILPFLFNRKRYALSLNGVDGFASFSSTPAFVTTFPDNGYSCRVIFTQAEAQGATGYLFHGGGENSTTRGVSFQVAGDLRWRFLVNDGTKLYYTAYRPFAAGQQVEAAFSLDKATGQGLVYENGTLVQTMTGNAASGTNQNFLVFGRVSTGTFPFKGIVYDTDFWRQTLTPAQMGGTPANARFTATQTQWVEQVTGAIATMSTTGATIIES